MFMGFYAEHTDAGVEAYVTSFPATDSPLCGPSYPEPTGCQVAYWGDWVMLNANSNPNEPYQYVQAGVCQGEDCGGGCTTTEPGQTPQVWVEYQTATGSQGLCWAQYVLNSTPDNYYMFAVTQNSGEYYMFLYFDNQWELLDEVAESWTPTETEAAQELHYCDVEASQCGDYLDEVNPPGIPYTSYYYSTNGLEVLQGGSWQIWDSATEPSTDFLQVNESGGIYCDTPASTSEPYYGWNGSGCPGSSWTKEEG